MTAAALVLVATLAGSGAGAGTARGYVGPVPVQRSAGLGEVDAVPLEAGVVVERGAALGGKPVGSRAAHAAPDDAGAAPLEAAATSLTLDALLDEVRARAPALISARASRDVVAADEVGAGVWPNPSASYGFAGTVAGADSLNGTQHTVQVAQPILIAGQGGARSDAAAAATLEADDALRADAAALERDARTAFLDLVAAQARVAVVRATIARLIEAAHVVDERAASGAGSRYDSMRIAAALAAQEAALAGERASSLDAEARVAALIGQPGARFVAVDAGDDGTRASSFAPERLWRVAAAQRHIEAKAKALARAEREAWPIPSVSAGAFASTSLPGVAVLAGVQSEIPAFDRNQSGIARARAEHAEAEALARQALVEARAAYESASIAAAQATAAVDAFRARTGGALETLRTMARDGYTSGKQSILELVDAEQAVESLELQRVDLTTAARRARLTLAFAAGALGDSLSPGPAT